MLCNACYAKSQTSPEQGQGVLVVPPHIQYQLLDFLRIEVPYKFTSPLYRTRPLPLIVGESHAAVERPLGGERPAEHDGVPGEETNVR